LSYERQLLDVFCSTCHLSSVQRMWRHTDRSCLARPRMNGRLSFDGHQKEWTKLTPTSWESCYVLLQIICSLPQLSNGKCRVFKLALTSVPKAYLIPAGLHNLHMHEHKRQRGSLRWLFLKWISWKRLLTFLLDTTRRDSLTALAMQVRKPCRAPTNNCYSIQSIQNAIFQFLYHFCIRVVALSGSSCYTI
jgi:hypothetical protein